MDSTEQQIAELIGQMTLEEKIALTIGRDFWTTNAVERLGIGPIAMNDGPHGLRKPPEGNQIGIGGSLPATCFPPAAALASSWDTGLVEEVGRALGEECLAQDVQVILGPGVNIKRTPLCGRNFEYFSEDPVLAGEMGAAHVRGVQSQGVGTSLKHYAANNQEWERMSISAEVDARTLREIYLAAFERIVKATQPWTIMAAYNRVNGTYCTENHLLLTDILKNEWGFAGVVVSDWGAVNEKDKSLSAGMDLEMPGPGSNHSETLIRLVREGTLSEAAVDAAAARVLALMLRGAANRRPGATYDQEAHHALARRAAADSMVLLKNDGGILPLSLDGLTSVAAIGRFAKTPRYQGAGSSQVNPTRLDEPYDALQGWLGDRVALTYADGYGEGDQVDDALVQEAVAQAKAASVAIIFAGLPPSYESEGWDRRHIEMPESHNRLIAAVCQAQPNTVVVLHNGSAIALPWFDGPKAVLEAGLGGQAVGAAVVDVLSGQVNPSGKLAETYPRRLEDTPAYLNYPGENGVVRYGEGVFVGYRYYEAKQIVPRFPFGYGLSYTTFEYSDLQPAQPAIRAGQTLDVSVTVRNSGARAGKAVVELYVQAQASQYRRPVKELKAFAKVALEPGESKAVRLTLTDRDFMVYDSARQAWRMEGGAYNLLAGGCSDAATLRATVQVEEDPQSARRVYTRMTLLKDFFADPQVGAVLMQAMSRFGGDGPQTDADREMFGTIPIGKLVNFGALSSADLDRLLAAANQQPNS